MVLGAPIVGAAAKTDIVFEISLDGVVDPLAARYVEREIAAAQNAPAIVVRIDTPGGLDSSMRTIIKAIDASRAPVVCWVGPSGARAASAGAIVMLGCPFATMAPGTNVGAAHPVGFSGELLGDKITNDAAAYARARADARDRDASIAERMVRSSISLSSSEALRARIIDAIAGDAVSALRALEGRTVRTASGPKQIEVGAFADIPVEPVRMSFIESVLHGIVDPNLAFLLLMLGLLGVAAEILHPGITVGGVVGGLSLLAALVVLGMLPVNIAGVLLIVLGVALFVVEAYVPGGLVGALGAGSVLAGGLFLFDTAVPGARVSRGLVIGTVASVAAFFLIAVRAVMRARRGALMAPTTDDLVGIDGVVEQLLDPAGIVRARNESWSARSTAGPVPKGARVRIVAVRGLTLEVEPIAADEPAAPEV